MAVREHEKTFDVAVVGGGPAGTATAAALAGAGYHVVVLERSRYEAPRYGETLSAGARRALRILDLEESFGAELGLSSGTISVWGSAEPVIHSAGPGPGGGGFRLDRRRFDAALARAAEERGATVLLGTRLTGCARSARGGWDLGAELPGGEPSRLRARLLADASGRFSCLGRRLGAATSVLDKLVGIIGFLRPADVALSFDTRALVEASQDGWWYSAVVPDGSLVVAFMTDGDLLSTHGSPACAWRHGLETAPHTREHVNACAPEWSLRVVAAQSTSRQRAAGPGWLAVGDAALGRDPLSGFGITAALESGLIAAHALAGCLAGRGGAPLDRYARWAEDERDDYLALRAHYYAQETRWRESPFWARRPSPTRP